MKNIPLHKNNNKELAFATYYSKNLFEFDKYQVIWFPIYPA